MLQHKVIITGTSRGIGFELVKFFAAAGHHVLALSRNPKPILDLGLKQVTALAFDLETEEDYKKISEFVVLNWDSKVHILINNAGKLIQKPFLETSLSDFEKVYKTNVFGVVQLTKLVIPYMPKHSHVVNISSMGGVQGSAKFAGLSAYSSSKGALITLTELLAEEYKAQDIAFNVLALGAVQTEMLQEAFPNYQAPTTAQEMANYIFNFALTGHSYYNGKLLQVANSTP